MKKILILIMLFTLVTITGVNGNDGNPIDSTDYVVVSNSPRFHYYSDLSNNPINIDLTLQKQTAPLTIIDYVATLEFLDNNGEVVAFIDSQIITWVYSGSGTVYNADIEFDNLFTWQDNNDIEEGNITFYRVRLFDLIVYSGAILTTTEIDNSVTNRVEFGYYPYNDNADYDMSKQYQFTTSSQDDYILLHYRNSDVGLGSRNIQFYDLTTGVIDHTISMTDIMESQLAYDFGAVEPDIDNITIRNAFIPLFFDGEVPEVLQVDIAGVNEEYEDLLFSFNDGMYAIYMESGSIEYVADAVWLKTSNEERSAFNLEITPNQAQIDEDNIMYIRFGQDQTFITDYYNTTSVILESTEFENFLTILTGTSVVNGVIFNDFSGDFSVLYEINYDYPEGAQDTLTWFVYPLNIDALGENPEDYHIQTSITYDYATSKDVGGTLYSWFDSMGLYNEAGGIFLIVFMIIFITIILASLKVTLPVYLLTYVLIVAFFTVMGLSTLWFNITFGILVIIGFTISYRKE